MNNIFKKNVVLMWAFSLYATLIKNLFSITYVLINRSILRNYVYDINSTRPDFYVWCLSRNSKSHFWQFQAKFSRSWEKVCTLATILFARSKVICTIKTLWCMQIKKTKKDILICIKDTCCHKLRFFK